MGVTEQMYPHTLTAWRKVPEGRSAAWTPLGSMRCRWEGRRGARSSASGDVSAASAQILILSRSFDAPLAKGDRVALGKSEEPTPPADALAVTVAAPYSISVARPDHWEVEAE